MENSDEKDAFGGRYSPYAGRQRRSFRTAARGHDAAELRLVSYSELTLPLDGTHEAGIIPGLFAAQVRLRP